MNTFDLVLLTFAAVLVVLGMLKGLVRILIGVLALVAAFAVAARFHAGLAARLGGSGLGEETLRLVAYLLIFLGVVLAGGLCAFVLAKLMRAVMLGWADRLGGAALGLLAALLAAALIVPPVLAYWPSGDRLLARSTLAPYLAAVADLATNLVPGDLSERYRLKIEGLRREWRRQASGSHLPRA